MSPNDRITVTFHFQERYWFEDSPAAESYYGDRSLGRSIALAVHPRDSLVGEINRYIQEHPDEFPAFRVADGHYEAELMLIRSGVATEDWRLHSPGTWSALNLVADVDSGTVEWFNFDNDWASTHATLGNVRATIDAGLLDGKRDEFVVYVQYPLGGDWAWWPEVGQWLFDQGVDLGLEPVKAWVAYKTGTIFTKYIRNGRRARRARRVARTWEKRGLTAPFQLREFVDLKRAWTLDELSNALAVPHVVSEQILKALGYTSDAGSVWRLGTNRKAIKRRARWMAREDIGDPINPVYDNPDDDR